MAMAPRLDIRLLTAVDMHGAVGYRPRRWIIAAEFVLGAIVGTCLGVLVAITSSAIGWTLFGIWLAGACLNYVPLALYALKLLSPGKLEAELEDVDIRAELSYYTKAQIWIAVPLLLVVLSVMQRGGS